MQYLVSGTKMLHAVAFMRPICNAEKKEREYIGSPVLLGAETRFILGQPIGRRAIYVSSYFCFVKLSLQTSPPRPE
jgi:hypothetical protein